MTSSQQARSPERAQDADTVRPSTNIFPFLKLPGELRDEIYGFLASTPHPVSRGHMPLIQFANICIQVRCEFRPMLLSQHIVNIDDACRYIQTFLIVTKVDIDHCEVFEPVKSIHIGVEQKLDGTFLISDLVPLLRLLIRHPMDVKVTFHHDPDTSLESLERLLRYRSEYWISLLNRNDIVGILRLSAQTSVVGFPVGTTIGLRQGNGWLTSNKSYNISCSNFVGPCETRIEKIRVFEGPKGRLMIDMSRYSDAE